MFWDITCLHKKCQSHCLLCSHSGKRGCVGGPNSSKRILHRNALKCLFNFPEELHEFSALLHQGQNEWEWKGLLLQRGSEQSFIPFLCKGIFTLGYIIIACSKPLRDAKPSTCYRKYLTWAVQLAWILYKAALRGANLSVGTSFALGFRGQKWSQLNALGMAKRPGESLPPSWPELHPWWRLCPSPVYLFSQNIYNWNALGAIMGISWSKSWHFIPVYQVMCLSRVGYWRDNMDIDSSSLSDNICYKGRKSLWNPTITAEQLGM